MSIKIDKEFESLIPPLSREEFKQLEENIVAEGIRDPLVVWSVPNGDDILIDGHNRWKISAKHAGIQFEIVKKQFQNRTDAKIWIIKNQIGRRNLSTYARSELVVMHLEPMLKGKAKENQGARTDISQKSVESHDTQKELAKAAGVSHNTIHEVKTIMEKADEQTKEKLRNNDPSVSIHKVYTNIKAEENEDKRQQANRELREAKKRAAEYQETDGKIADFGAVKQHKEDNSLIVNEFLETVSKTYMEVLHMSGALNHELLISALNNTDKRELVKIQEKISEIRRFVIKAQVKIEEVINEK